MDNITGNNVVVVETQQKRMDNTKTVDDKASCEKMQAFYAEAKESDALPCTVLIKISAEFATGEGYSQVLLAYQKERAPSMVMAESTTTLVRKAMSS